MREGKDFQSALIRELRKIFPGCIILKNDANYLDGVPDLLILWRKHWAALECKIAPDASRTANQKFYVNLMNKMSFAEFIHPENKETVLSDLQRAFGSSRDARLPRAQ